MTVARNIKCGMSHAVALLFYKINYQLSKFANFILQINNYRDHIAI